MDQRTASSDENGPITLTVWHTFAAESKEENVFLQSVKEFESQHPNITVGMPKVQDRHGPEACCWPAWLLRPQL